MIAVSAMPYVFLIMAAVLIYFVFRAIRLSRERQQMAARLVEVEQIKKDFISHVSHELKAPLASMQETTQLILERIPGPLTDKQQRLLELNLQSGKRLAQMIGNILDLSRLEAGIVEYEMQTVDIAELVHNVVIDLSAEARDKSLRILADIQREPLMVHCDPNRMVQLFTNLLENALRFSAKGGSVSVQAHSISRLPAISPAALARISSTDANNGFALIGISDSGPGIDDAQKEAIFHTFHQVKQGKKSPGESLGLGLAISRAVVEAHRGTIWVEDNPSRGSIFYVVLPRSAVAMDRIARAS